jgi:hypothetical protein
MSTAQAYYEIFKALPKKTRKEVQKLINNDEVTVSISVKHLVEGLKEIKKLKNGTAKLMTEEEFRKELESV